MGALLLCDMAHFAGLVAAGHPSEPRAALRLRDLDDAQDARRASIRVHPLQGGARAGGRPGGVPRDARRAAQPRDRREGCVLPDRGLGAVPALPGERPRERRRAGRDAAGGRARRADRRHRHPSPPRRPALDRVDGQGRRRATRRGRHHGQPEHRALRRARAHGCVRLSGRDARAHDPRLRRGRLPRGRPDHVRGTRARCGRRCPRRSELRPLRAAAAVPGQGRVPDLR